MELIFGFFIVAMVVGALLPLVFPLLVGLLIFSQFKKFEREIARQQQWLHAHAQQLATQQELQDAFVQRMIEAGKLAKHVKPQEVTLAYGQMSHLLSNAARMYPNAHWSNGAHFSGNDVIIPNGPSLIGGRLYVP